MDVTTARCRHRSRRLPLNPAVLRCGRARGSAVAAFRGGESDLCPHLALVCVSRSNWRELALLRRAKAPFPRAPIPPLRIASRVSAKSCVHRDALPRASIEPPIGAWSAILHFRNGKFFSTAKNAKDAKGRQDAGRSGNGLEIYSRGFLRALRAFAVKTLLYRAQEAGTRRNSVGGTRPRGKASRTPPRSASIMSSSGWLSAE